MAIVKVYETCIVPLHLFSMLHGNGLHYALLFILSTSVVIHFTCITEHYNGIGAFLYCVLSLSSFHKEVS